MTPSNVQAQRKALIKVQTLNGGARINCVNNWRYRRELKLSALPLSLATSISDGIGGKRVKGGRLFAVWCHIA
ncbi:unnamed protein product [Agarophyton chilense]